ncbi:hypothetical protein BT63DRAFT_426993 [Microthyrium microscopicum]|uniref:C3H1-type domain-containing protein n=1 Tax=Microthyrium microscopicum TaxID=703497 RepID=A0A6A6U3Q4_9PEZI|nr:hypothetical protein BT63DRAFT_426993 [Microthyrium microscopicum]
MVLCRFDQRGFCRNGDNCQFEHVSKSNQQNGGNRGGQGGFNRGGRGGFDGGRGGFGNNGNRNARDTDVVDPKIIETDLTTDRPIWPFSSYQPRSDLPRQLIEGAIEVSPDEMRCKSYLLALQGKQNDIVEIENKMQALSAEKSQAILSDLKGAVEYLAAGRDEHPNRDDLLKASLSGAPVNGATPFGQPAASAKNPFASPSAFGQPSLPAANPFGQSSTAAANPFGANAPRAGGFGQPSAPGTSAFGKPSLPATSPFGQATTQPQAGGFGQPSMLGKANPFGTPPAQSQAGGFGQPSAFGQPSLGQPSAFGQPAFGQAAPKANPFGQPPAPGTTPAVNPFGQPAQTQQSSPFGQPQQNTQASPFGVTKSASPFAQQPSAAGPFGQPAASPSPFGNNASTNANPFGAPSQPTSMAGSSPFGGLGGAQAPAQAKPNPFGQPQQTQGFAGGSAAANKHIFPSGPIEPGSIVDDPPAEMYGANEEMFRAAYASAAQNGAFEGGVMPFLPPKAAWITYDGI